jgi:hypothetical protein
MTCHVNEWIVKDVGTSRFYYSMLRIEVGSKIFVAKLCKVLKRVNIIVPVSATFVFEESKFDSG